MAGGDGTRFWPLSRQDTPKQLLNLSGKDPLINEAIDRLSRIAPQEIFVVTSKHQEEQTRRIVGGRLGRDHIIIEPAARNTAAAIGLAAIEIVRRYGDGVLVITPSDSYIGNEEEFESVIRIAVQAAENSNCPVTIGIKPTFPATGYGYIRCRAVKGRACVATEFVEKPDFEHAKRYVESGEYLWNSGMFVWKASGILEKYKELLPAFYADLCRIGDAVGTEEELKVLAEVYPNFEKLSVDNAVMERTHDILVVPGEFNWSDVGSWDMLGCIYPPDERGNVIIGDAVQIDSSNTVIYSKEKLVATVDVDNLIIVNTPDVVLVCPKDRAQDVKKLVEELRAKKREDLL